VLFGKLRPYFRKVYQPNFDGICSTDITVLEATEKSTNTFLFYFLANYSFVKEATFSSSGTRMPRANWDYLLNKEYAFPPLPEQRAIAKILSDLDSEIELLQKQNQTLEQIGQAIFKHWFVDFEFPNEEGKPYKSSGGEMVESELGEIPKGWSVTTIGKEFQTVLGGTPSTSKKEFWENGTVGWINSGKINEFRIIEPTSFITEEAVKKSATKLLPKKTIVIAITGATLGQVSRLEIDSCANQSVIGILENNLIKSSYIYFLTNHIIGKLIGNQTGGAQQHINKNDVNNTLFILPSKIIFDKYYTIADKIMEKISYNCFEILSLQKTRDLLLPKLMTGKIRI